MHMDMATNVDTCMVSGMDIGIDTGVHTNLDTGTGIQMSMYPGTEADVDMGTITSIDTASEVNPDIGMHRHAQRPCQVH